MIEMLLTKEQLSSREKLAFFRSLLKSEMDVLNQYCENKDIPKRFLLEICHTQDIKKINIARLLSVIEFYDPDFISKLINTDPRVRRFLGYYLEFLKVNPYGYEALEPQNLFGNWDFIKYKLKILFPELTLDEIEKFRFKRKEFIKYVKEKYKASEESIELRLNKTTWYEDLPYMELEEDMSILWHPEYSKMTEEDWTFVKNYIKGRKNIITTDENGKEKFVYVDIDLTDEELDKYRNDREGLKKLLMERYKIDEGGALQILIKSGWQEATTHIMPPIHTDVTADYGKLKEESKKELISEEAQYVDISNFIRYLGGLELEQLNYYELIYDKVEKEVKNKLNLIIRTQKRILGKLFGIFYTVDPLMAEAIVVINPDRLEQIKDLSVKTTIKDKTFKLFEHPVAWKIVKDRIASRFQDVSLYDIEAFKGRRDDFINFLVSKTGHDKEVVDKVLEECGWTKNEEVPAFLRQIGP